MTTAMLEQILSCPSLPSLPGTAVRVIELTGREDVSMKELAETIELDQALAAKVLRTVNSSFYGLRQRCATIERALVMLGLSPVKSLALGFSIVDSLSEDQSIDHPAYWERALQTAVLAKAFSDAAGLETGSEAFLGGLLQDVGMMAMNQALGSEYRDVVDQTEGDHRKLVRFELNALELQHPDVGAMLAASWKLPDELVMPIKFHERPTAAPPAHPEIVRAVGLGGIGYDALNDEEPQAAMRKLYQRGKEWLKLEPTDIDEVLQNCGEQIREMARLFSLPAGDARSADQVIAEARAQLEDQANEGGDDGVYLGLEEIDGVTITTDPATGLLDRESFDAGLQAMFGAAEGNSEPVTVIAIAGEGIDPIASTLGQASADKVLRNAATVLRKHFDPFGAIVGRISPSLFAVAVRGASHPQIERVCELARVEVQTSSRGWIDTGIERTLADDIGGIGLSIGVSTVYCGDDENIDPTRVLGMAVRFVQAARSAGGNCVRAGTGRMAA